ncbi:winged helix-turn-helix transcriptional regulator [Verticiella sediminum]|uniref:Winged helix-turn-helix transcriptional regulator n=1 Tax=Verticiella sediminum TaxID=1247510 RepID=A0A556A5Y9_9BURK|nr:MarR family winged helix-turn-helix transcriptional regulator [Verticiella sediminum]TSH88274.1 winged helix-turn-helix transcriptional regulator [Verticiella sediminum]
MSNEISYATTTEVRDACLCLHVQRAARALARRFDEVLRPVGLTNGQFSLLMALNRPEPPPPGPVAALLAMDRTSLTALLKPLQRRGLIEIVVPEEDRRARRLKLTAEGVATLARALPLWRRHHGALEAALPMGADAAREALSAVTSAASEGF